MSYALVCRSGKCVKELTADKQYFASTNIVQDKQFSPLIVCTPGPNVLQKYQQL